MGAKSYLRRSYKEKTGRGGFRRSQFDAVKPDDKLWSAGLPGWNKFLNSDHCNSIWISWLSFICLFGITLVCCSLFICLKFVEVISYRFMQNIEAYFSHMLFLPFLWHLFHVSTYVCFRSISLVRVLLLSLWTNLHNIYHFSKHRINPFH